MGGSARANITETSKSLSVEQAAYRWEWSEETDRFRLLSQAGDLIFSAPMQPAVVVQATGENGARRCTAGKLAARHVEGNRVTWTYNNVNGSGKLSVAWRFDALGLWIEPAIYQSSSAEDIVSLNLFASASGVESRPDLEVRALVLPGICESEAFSPIAYSGLNADLRTSLGRAGTGIIQQWALPCHYFCGFRGRRACEIERSGDTSRAFCCGLAELPGSDLFVDQKAGRSSLAFSYRGDIWGNLRGPGKFNLGASLLLTVAPNYYDAIRQYYRGLMAAGIIHTKQNSARKNAALLTPQWCTWGEQVDVHKEGSRLDQSSLEEFYRQLKSSGLKAGMFSIDDKWEGKYGNLHHSIQRFPHFEEFLARVRADGHRIGMWAAFMRCEDPGDLGLTVEQMLHRADGTPYVVKGDGTKYYLLDFTRPEVEKVLNRVARQFVRRYKPDLVKFDFGYEIPTLDTVAPYDKRWAGERMLAKGLSVIVNAMRQENPDIVVMYYELSPLFTDYFDLHSPDDLFEAIGEYDLEANRRFFFSGLCGEFGMPTYGSSGYDWASQAEIWFDSVAIGTLGCLGSFGGHHGKGNRPVPQILAKYNGLIHLVRPTNQFTVEPLDAIYEAVTRGAHASSWARKEKDEVVLLALRPFRLDGGGGTHQWDGKVSVTAQVAVSSLTQQSLIEATKLGVVPYGKGRLMMERSSKASSQAKVTEHYFGGASSVASLRVQDGLLNLPLREESAEGSPVEWIEVDLQA